MRDQAITLLVAALRHVRVLINTVPQPEESLEVIYKWVEDWDQTWAGIYLWWKYIDENKISILKVCDTNLHDMTEESVIWQNKAIPGVITIVDLQWPEGQHRFNIDDLFEDYQEWVEERAQMEAERLAKAPSMCTWGQAARGEGQDCAPEDTKGNPSRGAACLTGEGSGSASKGKGKQKATSEEDELADDVNNDEGDSKPGPPTKGPHTAGDNEPCETCAQANFTCVGEPEASCKQCRKAKCKCSCSQGVGRKQPDPTPTCLPLPDPAPSLHDPSPTPCLFFHGATPMPRPAPKPSPVPVDDPHMSLLIDELQVEIKPFFATVTSLLDEPGGIEVMAQSDTPSAVEILEVKYPHEWSTANIIEHL
ncbi:hypothetical protein F5J12DRAFT_899937 [Pisolithus orientalis]|uniref:uncharacterized protein n=1 Tax=Pisolithus orientalis TaxID=936130 RepID=UPI002224A745|nr:uncharacterized protein F5J12DRAFT_899937 [Pisolithus orientalis]KAI5982897.1 hypothetical protein F5J12DRAFT_899937 [Pisolithus orientalis]